MTDDAGPKTTSLRSLLGTPSSGVQLRVVAGPDSGQQLSLRQGTALVGTHPSCHLVLTDASVSRRHATFELLGNRVRVRDQGSKNGTLFRGAKVDSVEIPVGAHVDLGQTRLLVEAASDAAATRDELEGLLGRSAAMHHLFGVVEQAARSDAPVLIIGETGTGKEGVARALHRRSARSSRPLVIFDCASTPRELIAGILFGHAKGAFTGALHASPGLLGEASGGTIFLDEIGELPLDVQPVLLRALESKSFLPLGHTEPRTSDFRLVAATHRDLREEAGAGRFRQDLYFRLATIELLVPPLRERLEDVPLLAEAFAREAGASLKITPQLLARLCAHKWPGNVRELKNLVRRAVALGTEVNPGGEDLPATPRGLTEARDQAIKAFEKSYLLWLLEKNKGAKAAAAREAGVARSYFYRLLDEHGLSKKTPGA